MYVLPVVYRKSVMLTRIGGCDWVAFIPRNLQLIAYFFFFNKKTEYEMRISDWSSDVCSSDLESGQVSIVAVEVDRHRRGDAGEHFRASDNARSARRQGHQRGERYDALEKTALGRRSHGRAFRRAMNFSSTRTERVAKLGRASCRERECEYVYISGGAGN